MAHSSQSHNDTARDELSKRSIPHMTLSSGSPTSLTPPPKPSSHSTPEAAATARFAVTGNAILTGGTGTLALNACRALLTHGLSGAALLDLNVSSPQTVEQLSLLRKDFPSRTIEAIQVDVTDEQAVADAMARASQLLGSINHLLCFHGIVNCAHALETPASTWRRILDVNTTGTFLCAQAAARHMVSQQHGGSITFVASISAHRVNFPQPQAAYNVSKAALVAMKNSLAAEWARYGIRVNSVSPGYMDTILNEGEGLSEARGMWKERNPMGRMGSPSEIEGAVVLLASQAGSYMNGTDIVVDGGGIVF